MAASPSVATCAKPYWRPRCAQRGSPSPPTHPRYQVLAADHHTVKVFVRFAVLPFLEEEYGEWAKTRGHRQWATAGEEDKPGEVPLRSKHLTHPEARTMLLSSAARIASSRNPPPPAAPIEETGDTSV